MIERTPQIPTHSSTCGDEPLEVMSGHLTRLTDEHTLDAIIIATREGLLLTRPAQLSREDAELLAAIAPMLHDAVVPQWTRHALHAHLPEWQDHAISTHQLRMYEQPLVVLCAATDEATADLGASRAVLELRALLSDEVYRISA